MQKEYGKLTVDQFRELLEFVPEMLSMIREMNARLAGTPAAKFDSIMPGDYGSYNHAYELPFIRHLSLVVVALNRHGEVHDIAASPDPQEAVLELIRNRDEVEDTSQHPEFDDEDVVTLVYSLGRTIQSLATYERSISSLLQDVRENNNQDSLFKAIRMDRTVIGCPTAMKHIARAQIRDDKDFFTKLRNALKGPSDGPMPALEPMRYAFLILREMGIKDLSEEALRRLFVDELQVYADSPSSGKNLQAHYQKSKKIPNHLKSPSRIVDQKGLHVLNRYPFQEAKVACLAR